MALARRARQTIAGKPLSDRSPILFRRPRAGIAFSEDIALGYSAVYACVRVIAETIASLPWHVMRSQGDDGTRIDRSHPIDSLLHVEPNPEMGSFAWREATLGHGLLWGNGYSEIERDMAGRAIALWPLPPDRVTVGRDEAGSVVYTYHGPSGEQTTLPARDVFHLHGPGFDGLTGYPVIRLAKESVTLGLAAEEFGGTFFGRGVRPTGVYTHPAKLSKTAYENLKLSILAEHSGTTRALDPFIIEEGMTWQSIGIPPDDAQFLETRRFQVTDICRWFRVPPHKIADLENATFSNIEHQAIEFVTDTIMPWVVRLEREANRKLFERLPRQRWTKMNVNALLRGDIKARFEAYKVGRMMGVFNANDIRKLEDMNPLMGLPGSQYIVPMNMTTAEGIAEAAKPKPVPVRQPPPEPASGSQPPAASDEPDAASRALESGRTLQELMLLPIQRKLGREMGDIGKQAKRFMAAEKDRGRFGAWLIGFFNKQSELIAADYVSAATVLAERAGCDPKIMKARFAAVAREVAADYSDSSADELLDGWDAGRIDEVLAERAQTLPLTLAASYTDRTVSMIMLGVREKALAKE